jgi:hypothetical protein
MKSSISKRQAGTATVIIPRRGRYQHGRARAVTIPSSARGGIYQHLTADSHSMIQLGDILCQHFKYHFMRSLLTSLHRMYVTELEMLNLNFMSIYFVVTIIEEMKFIFFDPQQNYLH